ncbi:GspH/FimT family pseudopilin [Aestuariibacter halophilus]|uniref:Type II secretion system protein H n=1 Tax=Fluctibacter halophilus TaxID=226011 RepID=A0ABS8G2G8_9ALTE|nr:GspH/FimT family pseudopilin [Aestuariibacter halophilus]MCC2614689.1 GspH/FimT family pseudopilin [Aestuariibacter halophilus]
MTSYCKSTQRGMTLLEMMIALAIVAIVAIFVIPSAQTIITQNRIVAEVNETSAVMQFARNHAIDEQVQTVFCPSQDFQQCVTDWNQPKMVFADLDADGVRDDNEEILAATGRVSDQNVVTGPGALLRFLPNGSAVAAGTVLFCHDSLEASYARALFLTLQGRVRSSQDSNNDGVYEDLGGTALTCT